MTEPRIDLPQGTLDLLILRSLALGGRHGWAISARMPERSSEVLQVHQVSLYPARHRLERRGWVKVRWGSLRTIAARSTTNDESRPQTARNRAERMEESDGSRCAGARNDVGESR